MNQQFTLCATVLLILFACASVQAAINVSYVVTPADLADGPSFANGQGGEMFGYDPDSVKPVGSFAKGGAPGFASSSFWSDVQGSAAGGGTDYTAIRLSPKDIFGADYDDITVGQLSEISYWTNWESDLDWQIKIYTEPEGRPGWYGYRFNFERPNPSGSGWNQYDTTDDLVVQWIRSGAGVSTYPNAFLSDLDSSYDAEKIMFIDIISSYMTNSPPGDSYLDGIVMTLTDGSTASMNLEAVPEPASIAVWGLLGAGCAGGAVIRRRKRRAAWSDETRQDIHQIIERGRTSV